jgi:hypothetical protein
MKKIILALCFILASLSIGHATSTTQFMNQQGVNVHWTYDGTSYGSVNLPNALAYIGFKHVRAENGVNTNSTQQARLKGITDSGVKISLTYFWQTNNLSQDITSAEQLVSYLGAGAVEAIEGQNECDGNPNSLSTYNYNGLTGFAGCIQFQKDLYAAVKSDSNLSSVPYVYEFSQTFGSSQIGNTPDMSAWADVGNYHIYFSTLQGYVGIDNNMPGVEQIASTRPFILTESGWTDCAESGYPYYITRTASAPYSLSASLDAFQYNVHGSPLRLTKYELLDENSDPSCTDHEQHFGMFDSSGNPKPIATAWHNLNALFADPNPTGAQISPTGTVSVSGGVNSQVFTMSTGFVVALWTDASFMNISNHADVVPSNVSSTVQLGSTYPSVTVTDPVSGNVLGTYTNVNSVPVSFNGVAIVKVASNGSSGTGGGGTTAATAVTLSGPTSGPINTASTFTVTPNGPVSAATIITPATSNGGTFSPTTATIASGSSSSVTFNYTPTTAGTTSISITNNKSLTNSGTPISFIATSGSVATALILTGPTSGTVGLPSSNWTVTPNGSLGVTTIVTPDSNGGGGILTPSTLTFPAGSSAPQTFTFTPGVIAVNNISIDNNQNLSNNGIYLQYSSQAATTATSVALSGPTTGTVNTAATFTVTPNGLASAATVITPSSNGGGGTFSPTTVTIASGSSAAATFTYTPSTAGTISISITNNKSLTNTGTPISFVASSQSSGSGSGSATAITLSGPTTDTVGNPVTFTVTPNGTISSSSGTVGASNAISTTQFMDMQGINTHILGATCPDGNCFSSSNAYDVLQNNIPGYITYLGFHHIRDYNSINESSAAKNVFKSVTDLPGVTGELTYGYLNTNMSQNITAAEDITSIVGAGKIEGFESWNECSSTSTSWPPYTNQGYNTLSAIQSCAAFTNSLSAAIRGDANLAGILIYGPTLVQPTPPYTFASAGVPSMVSSIDYNNIHAYFAYDPAYLTLSTLPSALFAPAGTTHPTVLTESGYVNCGNTAAGGGYLFNEWVDYRAEAQYTLEASFDAYQLMYNGQPLRLYKYELLDEQNDPPVNGECTNHENNFGMFYYNGSPKPSAVAWHNLNGLFADPNPSGSQQSPVNLQVTNNVKSQLFTRSNGFSVALWNEVSWWNHSNVGSDQTGGNGAFYDVTPANVTTTVALGATYPSVVVTDPVSGNTLGTYTNVSSVNVVFNGTAIVSVTGNASGSSGTGSGSGSTTVVTPSDGGAGGTFSPTSITLNSGSSAGATFTYTPSSTGTKTISIANNQGLTNSGSPISLVVSASGSGGGITRNTNGTSTGTTTTAFMQDQGVNIHWTYDGTSYGSVNLVNAMQYIGFTFFRGENGINATPTQIARLKTLANAGIKYSVTYFWQDGSISQDISAAENLVQNVGGLIAIEGQNECDGNPSTYTYDGQSGFNGCIPYQSDLYTAVHADSVLSGIYVINASLTMGSSDTFPNMTAVSDIANGHIYFSAIPASTNLENNIGAVAASANHQVTITESGYTDAAESGFPYYVDLPTDGIYGINASLHAWNMNENGYRVRLVKYELLDENLDNGNVDHENHFGMFDFYGNPKPLATAWHNIATLFADPSPATAPSGPTPSLSFTNLPSSASSILLSKSTGFDIIVWNDISVYDYVNRVDINNPTISVVAQLGHTYPSVTVNDVQTGAVVGTYTNVSSVTLPLANDQLVIDVHAAAGATTATNLTLTGPTGGVVNVASTNFTVTPNANTGAATIITPSDGGNGGTFAPATATIAAGVSTSVMFKYTPVSTGTKTISISNNQGLSESGSPISYVVTPTPATALTLTGGTSGTVGVSSSFTVTPNGIVPVADVITPSDSGNGGTFSPTSVTITSNSSAPVSFTYTPASTGTKSISITNNQGLPVTGSPITFSVSAGVVSATSVALSGPNSGIVGSPSVFIATPNATLSSATVITPSDNGAGGTFSPISLTLAAGSTTGASFTYIPATSGAKSISISNNKGLTNTGSPISFTAASTSGGTSATSLAVSASSTGVVGSTINFTVTPNGVVGSTVVLTPSDNGAGGTFSPTSISIAAGSSTPVSFTYTPSSIGTKSITVSNNGGFSTSTVIVTVVANSGGTSATTITLSGPANDVIGNPSANFTVTPNGTVANTTTIVPSDNGNGGTFSPTSMRITAGSSTPVTFVYTPIITGTVFISITNNEGLTNNGTPITLNVVSNNNGGSGNVAASTITLTGPTTGNVGVASSNFTVSPNGFASSSVIITPSDGGSGGTFTPNTVTIPSGSTGGVSFTYTPATTGTKFISIVNNRNLVDSGSPITFTATSSSSSGGTGNSGTTGTTVNKKTSHTIEILLAGDSYNGNPIASFKLDFLPIATTSGSQVKISASRSLGHSQPVSIIASMTTGVHTLTVNFLNSGCGGPNAACSASTQRNLYVEAVFIDGVLQDGGFNAILSAGSVNIPITSP